MGSADVSTILWRERRLLDLLLFKLEEEQMVLASGRSRWASHAAREVEIVLDEIKAAELVRAVEVAHLGSELGLGSTPTLRSLIGAVSSPWTFIFDQHRQALLASTRKVGTLTGVRVPELDGSARTESVAEESGGGQRDLVPVTPQGVRGARAPSAELDETSTIIELRVARAAYRARLKATASVIQPSLAEFLH
jgi:hypothetical protein